MAELSNFVVATERSELDAPFFLPEDSFRPAAQSQPLARERSQGFETAHFIEPVSLVVAASVSLIAYRIVEHWLTSREHGVQIDARTSPATISNIAGIPAGFVVLISPAGEVSTHSSGSLTSSGLAALIGSLVQS